MRLRVLLWRSLRLRCPLCGQGKLFRNWFMMPPCCSHCGGTYQREGGYYLGSIYFNYGLTSLILAISYPTLLLTKILTGQPLTILTTGFVLLFPIWFFRYARSLWLGLDQFFDPREGEVGTDSQSTL